MGVVFDNVRAIVDEPQRASSAATGARTPAGDAARSERDPYSLPRTRAELTRLERRLGRVRAT
jgi:hypothetical protein